MKPLLTIVALTLLFGGCVSPDQRGPICVDPGAHSASSNLGQTVVAEVETVPIQPKLNPVAPETVVREPPQNREDNWPPIYSLDTRKVWVAADTSTVTGILGGLRPAASFTFKNEADSPAFPCGVTIKLAPVAQPRIKGKMWIVVNKNMGAQQRVEVLTGGVYEVPIGVHMVNPGQEMKLDIYLELLDIKPGKYAGPITLNSINLAYSSLVTQSSSGSWVIPEPGQEPQFSIRLLEFQAIQLVSPRLLAKYNLEMSTNQTLNTVAGRVITNNSRRKGKLILEIDGKEVAQCQFDPSKGNQFDFGKLKVLLTKGVHDLRIRIVSDHGVADSLQLTLEKVATEIGKIPAHFTFQVILCG